MKNIIQIYVETTKFESQFEFKLRGGSISLNSASGGSNPCSKIATKIASCLLPAFRPMVLNYIRCRRSLRWMTYNANLPNWAGSMKYAGPWDSSFFLNFSGAQTSQHSVGGQNKKTYFHVHFRYYGSMATTTTTTRSEMRQSYSVGVELLRSEVKL